MLNVFTTLQAEFSAESTVEDELIREIAKGNMDSFHKLYDSISASVYGFALSITKNTYDAEDVLHDTFLTVHRKAKDYEPVGKPLAWILTIAKNLSLMKLREHKKTGDFSESFCDTADASAHIENANERLALEELFRILGDDERQIVMLHVVGGLRNREIATLMDMSINTVLSKYNRAIGKLKENALGGFTYE